MLPAAGTARIASVPSLCTPSPAPAGPAQWPEPSGGVATGTRLAPAQDPQGHPLPLVERPRHRPSVARQREDAFLTETGNRQPELGAGKWLGWGCPREHARLPQPQQHPKNPERRSSRCSSARLKLPRTPEQGQGQLSVLGPPAWLEEGTGTGCPPAGTVLVLCSLWSPSGSVGPAEHPR